MSERDDIRRELLVQLVGLAGVVATLLLGVWGTHLQRRASEPDWNPLAAVRRWWAEVSAPAPEALPRAPHAAVRDVLEQAAKITREAAE